MRYLLQHAAYDEANPNPDLDPNPNLLQHAAYDEARAQLPDAPVIIQTSIDENRPYSIQQACDEP